MSKINLIPEVKQEKIRIQKLNAFITSAAVIAGAVFAVIILGLIIYNIAKSTQINAIKAETDKVNQSLESYKDLEQTELSLETGVAEINQILKGTKDWPKFFNELEKVTPNDIQITSLSVKDGAISMSLKGKNIVSIDRFIKSFSTYKYSDQNLFSDVVVNSFNKEDSGTVSFQAKMNFKEGILWQ